MKRAELVTLMQPWDLPTTLADLVFELRAPWRARALCRTAPNRDVFFPRRGENLATEAARAVCAGCPVREPCLNYALDHNIKNGVWGGTSERERRPLPCRPKAA